MTVTVMMNRVNSIGRRILNLNRCELTAVRRGDVDTMIRIHSIRATMEGRIRFLLHNYDNAAQ